jgi:hypothetical protein
MRAKAVVTGTFVVLVAAVFLVTAALVSQGRFDRVTFSAGRDCPEGLISVFTNDGWVCGRRVRPVPPIGGQVGVGLEPSP